MTMVNQALSCSSPTLFEQRTSAYFDPNSYNDDIAMYNMTVSTYQSTGPMKGWNDPPDLNSTTGGGVSSASGTSSSSATTNPFRRQISAQNKLSSAQKPPMMPPTFFDPSKAAATTSLPQLGAAGPWSGMSPLSTPGSAGGAVGASFQGPPMFPTAASVNNQTPPLMSSYNNNNANGHGQMMVPPPLPSGQQSNGNNNSLYSHQSLGGSQPAVNILAPPPPLPLQPPASSTGAPVSTTMANHIQPAPITAPPGSFPNQSNPQMLGVNNQAGGGLLHQSHSQPCFSAYQQHHPQQQQQPQPYPSYPSPHGGLQFYAPPLAANGTSSQSGSQQNMYNSSSTN